MSEWPNEHAWKVCIQKCIEGSTPSLTATDSLPLNHLIPPTTVFEV